MSHFEHSDQILTAIDAIAAENSKNAKQVLLASYGANAMFFRVVKLALDPFVTFGIGEKSLPKHPIEQTGEQTDGLDDHTWTLLDKLAKRTLTGGLAVQMVGEELARLSHPSQELLKRILLKDLRAGFSESTANKAIPGWVPTFDCMLAHPYSEHKHKLDFPLWVEPKFDGVRVLAFVDGNSVGFYSRSGKEFTTFEHLKIPLALMVTNWLARDQSSLSKHGSAWVLDAEVVSGSFNKTVSEVRKKDTQATDARLVVFDILPIETFSKPEKSGCRDAGEFTHRRRRLVSLFDSKVAGDPLLLIPGWWAESEQQIHGLYTQMRDKGLEGVIVKDPKALYHRRRNHAWTKIKAEESVDVAITGAIEGTGKYAGMLGALVVDFEGVSVNVGTGFDDAMRQSFWAERNALIGRTVEIGYHEITPDRSLRHPRFTRFRDTLVHGVKE